MARRGRQRHDLRRPAPREGARRLEPHVVEPHPDKRVHHYLDRMSHAVSHMGDLLDGLVVLAHVAGRDLGMQDVDLGEMAAEVIDGLRRRDPDRDVEVSIDKGLVARADKRLMAVLLENLLANAWKFSGKTPDARIDGGVRARAKGETVFFVRDNGAGFDMAHATRLFAPFERLHTTAEFPGTGIGLATVQRVVLRHGGRVWAEAKAGEGASFYFALPGGARQR